MTVYMVTHKCVLLSQQVRNVYYYETTVGNPSVAEWTDIVDEIRADYVSEFGNDLANDFQFHAIDYRIVDSPGLLSFEAVPTAGIWGGGGTVDPLPTQIALLVSVKGTTTKPNRARTYLCGFMDDQVVDGLWTNAVRGIAEDFIDFQSVLNSGGTNPLQRVSAQWNSSHTQVIVHNNIAGSAGLSSQVPATQRRRRIGVGI